MRNKQISKPQVFLQPREKFSDNMAKIVIRKKQDNKGVFRISKELI